MLKKLIETLESVSLTIISGVFLAISLILPVFNIRLPIYFDPAWISVIVSSIPLIYSAIKKIIYNKGISKISSALLISIAMTASVAIGDIFAAGEIAFIMAIGEILEDKTTKRAKRGLKNLIDLAPTKARRVKNGKVQTINTQEIKAGDVLRIFPGETVPVDGEIISGETSIDQSIITGESLPVDKAIGDSVFCATINRFGAIDIKASKVGEDSSLQKLIRMVKEAENKKAPMQRIADKWASLLVPVALLLAVVSGILKQDIVVAVTMLVVFCPCALVLATPTAIMAAIGQAAKHGVIIKSGEALEKMGKVDTVAFDKTGTLTYGKLEVSDIITFNNDISEDELLILTASAECKSEHPLGKAIVNKARSQNLDIIETSVFRMDAGKGIYAKVQEKAIYCGNEKYLDDNGIIANDKVKQTLSALSNQGKACVTVAVNNDIIGIIALSDILKPNAKEMITQLSQTGTSTVLLTGDSKKAANYFANSIGITEINAELLPEEKVQIIADLQNKNKNICMIGDGVNDAPALKTADVGVAMATIGSDIAIEAADIALMGDDISKIPYLKRLSNATVNTIKFSILLSLGINFLAIVLSFFEVLTPTTGALVHNAGSLLVILIAALLYDRKFDK